MSGEWGGEGRGGRPAEGGGGEGGGRDVVSVEAGTEGGSGGGTEGVAACRRRAVGWGEAWGLRQEAGGRRGKAGEFHE
jgi:hypothetical protein